MIKLIAIDVDGTLLNTQNQLTNQTKSVIAQVRAQEVKIVLCTGRPFQGIETFLTALGLDKIGEYAISYNGAVTQALGTQEVIHHQSIAYSDFLEIEALCRKLDIAYHIQSDVGIYTSNRTISTYTAYDSCLNGSTIFYRTLAELERVPIHKVLMVDSPKKLQQKVAQIPKIFFEKYHLVKSLDYFFEFLHRDVSKGNAIKQLAQDLKLKPDEIMAIGDNDNDVSMFLFSGLSIAMGNGSKHAKEVSDFVTKSNDDDGVAYALSSLLLKKH
ncbi:sugar-phosphatase [Enterococcus casseliflavus]|uniref:sugar-phosphatase n=1 Tax=Enterococcus casseliflavus TaxID=37734 RepID=UPI00115CC787|nr:sugar-phosphatase [Enterococcus casseliflavus]